MFNIIWRDYWWVFNYLQYFPFQNRLPLPHPPPKKKIIIIINVLCKRILNIVTIVSKDAHNTFFFLRSTIPSRTRLHHVYLTIWRSYIGLRIKFIILCTCTAYNIFSKSHICRVLEIFIISTYDERRQFCLQYRNVKIFTYYIMDDDTNIISFVFVVSS